MSQKTPLERGREILKDLAPDMEQVLEDRYGDLLPGMPESLVEWAYGRHYSRPEIDLKTRYLITIGAPTALGGQTTPQLKINISSALKAGATRQEIAEAIWQMALYGGMPAAINGLNAARDVFAAEDLQG